MAKIDIKDDADEAREAEPVAASAKASPKSDPPAKSPSEDSEPEPIVIESKADAEPADLEAEMAKVADAAAKKIKVKSSEPDTEEEPEKEADPAKEKTIGEAIDEHTAKLEEEADKPEDEVGESTTEEDQSAAEPEEETTEPAADQVETEEPPEDVELDEAVVAIEKNDSEELIKNDDETLAKAFEPKKPESFGCKLRHALGAWWHNPLGRWVTIIAVLAILAGLAAVPTTRYFILNTAGVRASAKVSVLDDKTGQPLKNVHVSLSGVTVSTDSSGNATLDELKLGPTTLVIEKPAFATINQPVTLGWGSNPLGEMKISATGSRYTFKVNDWLSKKPLPKVEASSGEGDAIADKDGKLVLVLPTNQTAENVTVTFVLEGYRTEKLTMPVSSKDERSLTMVPSAKQVFVSKRSGKYDVYKIDIDAKNEKLLLAGTGTERDDMVLAPQPSGNSVALVSTRDNDRNKDGFVKSGLFLIDIDDGEVKKLAISERIQIIDWVGDNLVYVKIADGASASNPKRHRLVSYNIKTAESKELATSNYFNDLLSARGKIYYAPSNAFQENTTNAKLFVVNADGTNKQVVLDKEAWNIFRTDYENIAISVQQSWYGFALGGTATTKLTGPPSTKSKIFVDNTERSKALWVEERDGKGTLLVHDVAAKTDTVLKSQAGLVAPVRWLSSSYVIYRIYTPDETADYVISTQGGEPVKIKDVSNIASIDKWYFY